MAPDLACSVQVEGRFASIDHYRALINRMAEEATAHYEDKYL
jgi:hypothetical protein